MINIIYHVFPVLSISWEIHVMGSHIVLVLVLIAMWKRKPMVSQGYFQETSAAANLKPRGLPHNFSPITQWRGAEQASPIVGLSPAQHGVPPDD